MQKMIVKSFRLPSEVAEKMKHLAEGEDLTQGELLSRLVSAYELMTLHEQYLDDLKKMESDEAYQKEQQALAAEDYL